MAYTSDTFVLLQLEHRTIAHLLELVEAQLRRLERDDEADFDLLELVLNYFRVYPEACHHPKEDLVFRRLQLTDPEAAATVGDLLGGHEALETLTAQVAELVGQAQDSGEPPAQLLEGLREFVHRNRSHLEEEESEFFPLVASKLSKDEWDVIDFAMFDMEDPIYNESTENRFIQLRKWIQELEAVQPDDAAE